MKDKIYQFSSFIYYPFRRISSKIECDISSFAKKSAAGSRKTAGTLKFAEAVNRRAAGQFKRGIAHLSVNLQI